MEIVKGKEKEYKKYVKMNSKNSYSSGVIKATEIVGNALDKGKSPKEAMDGDLGGITGFMAGCLAQAITRFHPRGKEFKKWWNESYGVKDAKGVVNPAIVTFK